MRTHPQGPAALQDSLRFGVTTVLGMGVTTTADEKAVRAAAANRVDVADYRSAGTPATAPGAHGTFGVATSVAGPDQAEAFVEARKSAGSDYLKILLNGVRTARDGTLSAATAKAADAFRLGDRGRIAPKQRADLLLVRGDPTTDITATRDILRVWRSGVEFDRHATTESRR